VELTRDHPRSVGTISGTEPPLLRLLEVAIKADTSGASGGSGRNKNSAPLDVTALALWEDIARVVGDNWPGRGDLKMTTTHLIDRLTWWTNTVAGTDSEPHLLEFCEYWRYEIRELLEPTRRVPLRGQRCSGCKETWLRNEQDGQTTLMPVLVAYPDASPMRVKCLSCDETYEGLALQLLA